MFGLGVYGRRQPVVEVCEGEGVRNGSGVSTDRGVVEVEQAAAAVDGSDGAESVSVSRRLNVLDGKIDDLAWMVCKLVGALSKDDRRGYGFDDEDQSEDEVSLPFGLLTYSGICLLTYLFTYLLRFPLLVFIVNVRGDASAVQHGGGAPRYTILLAHKMGCLRWILI